MPSLNCTTRMRCYGFLIVLLSLLITPFPVRALDLFPLQATVSRVRCTLATNDIESTGLRREDYLAVMAGIVDYFQHFQNEQGRIIDPFQHKEIQYSTPCYAWAAAALVASGRQTNLLPSATLALESALEQLAAGKAADNHGDFFTFPAMLAYEHLRERVPLARRRHWEELLRAIEPERAYQDRLGNKRDAVHNWNVVALSGEFLRHQQGFTGMNYVEDYLTVQIPNFTADGLYRDPNVPMAYDHFPRHFLAAILQRGYDGKHRRTLEELLDRAAWTSLLMQSPCGELPTGGRSAQHQWNEAMQCVTYEIWAARELQAGDTPAARAFKRAAHLSLQSIRRWIRPSGELWIVKNRFDPAARHGFQGYSFHSQYNLLAASMLATAWLFANDSNDSIPEGPCPADLGGFAILLPEFHKIIANAGGLYVELDTGADPGYNSTGLIRVHKGGVNGLIGPSDGSAIQPQPLAVGIGWREGDHWQPLAGLGRVQVKRVAFKLLDEQPKHVQFNVRYELGRTAVDAVSETYELTPEKVRVTAEVQGDASQLRVQFPALAFDGQDATAMTIDGAKATVALGHDTETFEVESPTNAQLHRAGELIYNRNGYLEAIQGDIEGKRIVYTLKPQKTK